MGGGLLSIASKYGKQIPSSDEDLRGFAINFFNSELMLNSSWESERRDLESIRASAGAKSIYGPIRDAWLKGFFKGAKEVLKYN